jgi:hypothetical protein
MSKAIAALVRLGLESHANRKREFFKKLKDNLAKWAAEQCRVPKIQWELLPRENCAHLRDRARERKAPQDDLFQLLIELPLRSLARPRGQGSGLPHHFATAPLFSGLDRSSGLPKPRGNNYPPSALGYGKDLPPQTQLRSLSLNPTSARN